MLAGVAIFLCCFPAIAAAGLILDAGLRFVYEDNVIGLLSDQQTGGGGGNSIVGIQSGAMNGKGPQGYPNTGGSGTGTGTGAGTGTGTAGGTGESPADYSTTISAEAGWFTALGASSTIFVKGFALYQAYGTYTFLDTTQGGVSAGIGMDVTKSILLNVSAFGAVKQFDDTQRNSSAYGGSLTLKENLTPSFWFRQLVDYELNNADNALFSYSGITGGLGLGYGFSTKTQLALGYNFLVREFDEPSSQVMRTGTAYLGIDQSLGRNWTVSVEYDNQESTDSVTGMTMTNNIYSLAVRYDY